MGAGVLGFDPALLRSIAERIGTPTYVYSANLIRAQYHAPHRICYSVKANGNLGVLKVLRTLGAGADIVSVGELRRALAAGFEAGAIVFSGVGKTGEGATARSLDSTRGSRSGQPRVVSVRSDGSWEAPSQWTSPQPSTRGGQTRWRSHRW